MTKRTFKIEKNRTDDAGDTHLLVLSFPNGTRFTIAPAVGGGLRVNGVSNNHAGIGGVFVVTPCLANVIEIDVKDIR